MIAWILRFFIVIVGGALLYMTFRAYVRKRMSEKFCLYWVFVALLLILLSVIPVWSKWSGFLASARGGAVGVCIGVLMVVFGMFSLSCTVSQLNMRNKELAMQVSLLNQENEQMLRQLERLQKQSEREERENEEEKAVICHQHSGPCRSGGSPDGAAAAALRRGL